MSKITRLFGNLRPFASLSSSLLHKEKSGLILFIKLSQDNHAYLKEPSKKNIIGQLSKAITIAKTMKSKIHQTPDYDQKKSCEKEKGHRDTRAY